MHIHRSMVLMFCGSIPGLVVGCQRPGHSEAGATGGSANTSSSSSGPSSAPTSAATTSSGGANFDGGERSAPLSFSGTVTDTNGAPIALADVSLAANPAIHVETGADGSFVLSAAQPTGNIEPPRAPAKRLVEHTLVVAKGGYLDTYRGVPGSHAVGLRLTELAAIPVTAGGVSTPAPFVAQYLGDKLSAVTMTFDDTKPSQLSVAKPLLDLYGYKSTFYLTSTSIGPDFPTTWPMWKAVANDGYEIGNHGGVHWIKPECTPENDLWNRSSIFGGYDDIKANIGTPPLTFAIPGGGEGICTYPLITESGHVDWRRNDHILDTDRVYPEGDDLTVATATATIDMVIAHSINWNGAPLSWFLFYMHDVTAERAVVLEAMLDYISARDDQVWCTGYGAVTVYEREREESELSVLQWGPRSVTFRLSNNLDAAIFSSPLTVVIPLPMDAGAVEATAFRESAGGPVEVRARTGRLLVNVKPGPQSVQVSW